MSVPNLSVRVEDVGPEHIDPYAELSYAEYGDTAISQRAHLQWKFLDNPQGASVGIHLFDNDRLVGRVVAQPRVFTMSDGSTRRAAFFVDLLIHPDFRGISSLVKLMSGLREVRERFDFALVTPNATGIQVWQNLLRMPEQFQLGVRVAVLRPGRLVGMPTGLKFISSAIDGASSLFTRAVARLLKSATVLSAKWPEPQELNLLDAAQLSVDHGSRDAAFLQWRFQNSPTFKYQMYFLRKRGALVGYIASRTVTYSGRRCRFIIDAVGTQECSQRDWLSVRWQLQNSILEAGDADLVTTLGNHRCGALGRLAGAPFFRIGTSLLPQNAPLFAEWWKSPIARIDAQRFTFTLADCDMI